MSVLRHPVPPRNRAKQGLAQPCLTLAVGTTCRGCLPRAHASHFSRPLKSTLSSEKRPKEITAGPWMGITSLNCAIASWKGTCPGRRVHVCSQVQGGQASANHPRMRQTVPPVPPTAFWRRNAVAQSACAELVPVVWRSFADSLDQKKFHPN